MAPTTKSPRRRRAHPSSPRWQSFQATPTSARLLSPVARQEGHAVLRVPPGLRELFLDLAWVFTLYERYFQTPQRPPSAALLAQFVRLTEQVQTLVQTLRAEGRDA